LDEFAGKGKKGKENHRQGGGVSRGGR
jgi:hypothetical protein